MLKATLAAHEAEVSRARKTSVFEFSPQQFEGTEQANENWSPGAYRRSSIGEVERQRRTKRRRILATAVAAGIAACALAFHTQIEDLVGKAAHAQEETAVPASAPAAAPAPVSAVLIRAANVHVAPVLSAEVISTLQKGTKVELLDQRGIWTHVRFTRKIGSITQEDGWVSTSFLKQEKSGTE